VGWYIPFYSSEPREFYYNWLEQSFHDKIVSWLRFCVWS
jgi:hypothetical protein